MSTNKYIAEMYVNHISGSSKKQRGKKSLTDIYGNLYTEAENLELDGIAPGSGTEEDDRIAVFYINSKDLTDDVVAQFRELGGEGPVNIPASYFTKIERRFRGKTIEAYAEELVKVSTEGGKVDPMTYESFLNKLFSIDIRGAEDLSEMRQFLDWKKGTEIDGLIDNIHIEMNEEVSKTIDFVKSLSSNVAYFISTDPKEVLEKLWVITEQASQVSIGKGEMALAVLTRGMKGEPGDVKIPENGDLKYLVIEVKGLGGRPGKDLYAHAAQKKLEKLVPGNVNLSDISIDSLQSELYTGNSLISRWEEIEKYFNTTFRNKLKDVSGYQGGDHITDFLNKLERRLFRNTKDTIKTIINGKGGTREILQGFSNWLASVDPEGKKVIANSYISKLVDEGTGGVAFYVQSKQVLNDVSFITKLGPKKWGKSIRGFFNFLAKDMNLSEDVIADGLVQTRSDTLTPALEQDLRQGIYDILIREGKEIVYNRESLGLLVGAIQFTGYCSADGFNRALFINDHSLMGRSIPTDPDNIITTLNAIYDEFTTNDYSVKLDLDKRNKGVQIFYNG